MRWAILFRGLRDAVSAKWVGFWFTCMGAAGTFD